MRQVILTLHNKTQVESVPPGRDKLIIAKKVITDNMVQHYLKTISSRLVNPAETSVFELRKDDGVLVKVSEKLYNMYHEVINGNSRVSFRSLESFL